jgi:hypothetical protein
VKNFIDFFFSFDKLFKEKLIIPFFWLAIIVWGLAFISTALGSIQLAPLAAFVKFINFFASILLALVTIRLLSELAVAVFRINDNLSPDGGKSESADIDIMAETRRAAEAASMRAREFTHSATEKTKAANKRTKSKTEGVMGKGSVPDDSQDPTPTKILEPTATTQTRNAAKARSSAKSKTKPTPAKKASSSKSTAPKKRGPKPGTKAPRDKDGNLLKKDGTPRKKPGPKSK